MRQFKEHVFLTMCSLQTSHLIWCAFLVSIAVICIAKTDEDIEYKTVDTNNGKVRGIRKTSLIKEVNFYSFKGIPYARSPTRELRFKVSFFLLLFEIILDYFRCSITHVQSMLFLTDCVRKNTLIQLTNCNIFFQGTGTVWKLGTNCAWRC